MASELPNDGWFPSPEDVEEINKRYEATQGSHPELSEEQQAKEVFTNNVRQAAQSIVNLALTGQSERIRLSASQYVVDRIMGKPGQEVEAGPDKPLEKMFRELLSRNGM
jgi:hypothetical protein